MSNSINPGNRDCESNDAERLNSALKAIQAGDISKAQALLSGIISNTPDQYVTEFETDGVLHIKFWDVNEFKHFVKWQNEHGPAKNVTWIGNAYPRAFYYLGFLKVKTKEFQAAIDFLDRGLVLEPSQPKFKFEKAQAYFGLKRLNEALALYKSVDAVGPRVTPADLAMAHRGQGFVLIEMGDLQSADVALRESLKYEPGNRIALGELDYISHLRQGGKAGHTESVATTAPKANVCAACGRAFTKGNIVESAGKSFSFARSAATN